jgi:hypothetical protein
LVLWIDQNTFATSLLEKVFKGRNLPFYTIPSAEDFLYLVEDLRPEVIVLDGKTALANLQKFREQYERMSEKSFILLDGSPELSFIREVVGEVKRPFDPFAIPDTLARLVKSN